MNRHKIKTIRFTVHSHFDGTSQETTARISEQCLCCQFYANITSPLHCSQYNIEDFIPDEIMAGAVCSDYKKPYKKRTKI